MRSILPLALIMGALAGLLVGGFMNVFNVPVMEWAIELEGAAAAAEAPAGEAEEEATGFLSTLETLGAQRIGLVLGLAVLGVVYGAIFTGLFHLVRRAFPGWNIWAWALIGGVLCFWSVSLFTQLKYPLNPPGIGEDGSLLARQGFQFLFILLSVVAVIAVTLVLRFTHEAGRESSQRFLAYAGTAAAYVVVAVALFAAIPGNPDPIPEWVPEGLIIMFRTFSILGHLLLWMIIALGVSSYTRYQERGLRATASPAAGQEMASASRQ
ncbi:MAG: CbtA family protein [Chloroflexota bacterium]|nr:CbtA family protein [Chloroflexota bacterium]